MMSRKSAFLSTCGVQCNTSNDRKYREPKRNRGLPDILFPTEGKKSAGNETIVREEL